jgi:ABC-2 type transport system ATP-binding protein
VKVPVLAATGLGFSYGGWRPHRVFENFDWEVRAGETTMLLGPNGSGKSTLLKLLCGFERPDSGAVTLGDSRDRRTLYDQVGWMPQDVQPARGLTVTEQIAYVAWVGGASRREALVLARRAVIDVDLEDKRDARTTRLSGGQLRRVGLAQAIVRRTPVLLLDEPTAGLDPAQAATFRALLGNLDCPGGIVVSTHQVNDLADDVDRVVVIAGGSIRFDGTAEELRGTGATPGTARTLSDAFTALVGGGRH